MTKQNIKAAVNETEKMINWMEDINTDIIHVLPFQGRKEKVSKRKKKKPQMWHAVITVISDVCENINKQNHIISQQKGCNILGRRGVLHSFSLSV